MARFQQSIEIGVPVHAAYQQLMRFEEYPRFMHSIDDVRRLDDRHLHWRGSRPRPDMEWDSEITEELPDRCIAWRNVDGPPNAGRVELQPLAPDKTGLIMTMECDPLQFAIAQDGDVRDAVTERIRQDLARLKAYIETQETDRAHGTEAGSDARQAAETTQSDYSLSQSSSKQADEDGRFTVSEEVNFDEQSERARHMGEMPGDAGAAAQPANPEEAPDPAKLKQSIERSIPPGGVSG